MAKKSEKDQPYSPMGVLGMLKKKGVPVPVGKDFGKKASLVDKAGTPVYEKVTVPETCPVLLLAFTQGSKLVPDDFHNVEKTGKALRAYVRPDGGVYLGAFQPYGEPDGVVVVFGDPAMSQAEAQKIALHYRDRLIQQYAGEQALKELGPFSGLNVSPAAAAVTEPAPAVSMQDE